MPSTNERARAGSRPTTVTSWMERSAARHVSWKPAWTPIRRGTTGRTSRPARKRAAGAEVGPVLSAVRYVLSTRGGGRPVAPSINIYVAWMVGRPRPRLPAYTLTSLLPRSWSSPDSGRSAAGITSNTPSGSTARAVRGGTSARPAALSANAFSSAATTSRGVSTRSRSARERISTLAGVTRARRELDAANHALDARLQHHLAPLVEHAVGVRHDAAIRLLGLALVHHLDLDPHRVALEDRSDHADLAAQPRHARAVDEAGLHDQALGQPEGQRCRRGPAAADGFPLTDAPVHEERLGEATLVHEVDDVGLGHRAAQRAIPRPDGVLLERQSASQHVAPPRYGVRAYSPR